MKKIAFSLVLILLVLPFSARGGEKITATLFYSSHCKSCLTAKQEILPPIVEKYKDEIDWVYLCTSENADNLALLKSIAVQFKEDQALVPAIFISNNFLVGVPEIKERLEGTIEDSLKEKSKIFTLPKIDLLDLFNKFSTAAVALSGLADGVNPCAFAVMVFFISFLAVYGYRKREIVLVGIAYCLAVFITYLLIGLGFFKFFYMLEEAYLFIRIFYYFISGFCFLTGGAALFDYFKFKKTGKAQDAVLQLPKFFKKRINFVIGSHMREKKQSALGLIITSFLVGFLVSLLEAVCTGQVYLPTIVFILKNTSLKLKAAGYLVLYNFMFILPLIIIFLLSLLGVSSAKFNNFLKRNAGRIKIILAIVFFTLGVLVLFLN
ncbi:MAG: hypothetical protein ABIH08_02890 [Candidatus Omnitrophota bacterium]